MTVTRPAAQRRAVIAVLDTLIQENVQVPIPAINALAESFPSQAVILIGRLPVAESRVTLGDWTFGETRNWSGRTLARIASNDKQRNRNPALLPVL